MPMKLSLILLRQIVSRDAWIEARKALLIIEKEATRAKDELSRLRRELPMVKVEKEYKFTGADNVKCTLSDLFEGRGQYVHQMQNEPR